MAFQAKDGKRFGSKFRMSRYESAHPAKPGGDGGGERAQAHELEAKPTEEREERLEEEVHPGIHEEVEHEEEQPDHSEIQQVAAEHGPAHTIHITHDHEAGQHHVHSLHPSGYEHHADHSHPMHAHHHAMHAAGMNPEAKGEYPEGHEALGGGGGGEFEPEVE